MRGSGSYGIDYWSGDYNVGSQADLNWFENLAEGVPDAFWGIFLGFAVMIGILALAMLILQIVGMARAFKKAKQPGWAAIVPFYNNFTMIKICGLELWWFVALTALGLAGGYHFGIAACVMLAFTNYKVAKSFGKDAGFAIGLTLLPPIFWMMLGYSNEIKYKGPAGPYKIKHPEPTHKK